MYHVHGENHLLLTFLFYIREYFLRVKGEYLCGLMFVYNSACDFYDILRVHYVLKMPGTQEGENPFILYFLTIIYLNSKSKQF